MPDLRECRTHVRLLRHMDEDECLERLRRECDWPRKRRQAVRDRALELIAQARRQGPGPVEAFLLEYGLSSADGRALMALAEALPRIPDSATKDAFIADKLEQGHWGDHRGHSPSRLVNLSTIALTLAGRIHGASLAQAPLRAVLDHAVRYLGDIFVMGESLSQAMDRADHPDQAGSRHSFDMLGEEARTARQADDYFKAYQDAIAQVGRRSAARGPVAGPGISVKLSALHPRYTALQGERVLAELVPRLLVLCRAAADVNIGLTIDAEEADRLELSLDVVEALLAQGGWDGWQGLGLAVQAYQKRAVGVVDWAAAAARTFGTSLVVRLVKGAYWDAEIKRAQERGHSTYPVFTTKAATDLSYLACAQRLLQHPGVIRPAFATHNAATLAAMAALCEGRDDWEFQRLHGMGTALYGALAGQHPCRVYAPVGAMRDLLPYLVRRLLENGANTSFIHALADQRVAAEEIVNGPVDEKPLKVPPKIFHPQWLLAKGPDLSDGETLMQMRQELAGISCPDVEETGASLDSVVNKAVDAFPGWDRTPASQRADILERAAAHLEQAPQLFLKLAQEEAGKTWGDAIGEIREAVDFLRYYAAEARRLLDRPMALPAISGEDNQLHLRGRGVFACISPWNFPLSIFIGQAAAALAAGNAIVAKPAPQTPRMARAALDVLYRSGLPDSVAGLVVGGPETGEALVSHPAIAGVAFTGSHATAKRIQAVLAGKSGPIVPLIAETGGINAMIVDSTALPEQVAADVVASAFLSAGQRCSALRLLFVQDEVADKILDLVAGMVAQLRLGDPADPSVDIGPIIDQAALDRLHEAETRLSRHASLLFRGQAPQDGNFMAPVAYAVTWDNLPKEEIFGPLLQVCRWRRQDFTKLMDWLARNGHGLTLGVHTRIETLAQQIATETRIGNIYVNRGMTGAMVGCQPFGGMGLSGTGPKSGGPHTLIRFVTETVVTTNTAALGGNVGLLCGER
ncbi:MAG: L-glutamate gamma-semialdehyde dehydrogenase [Magnetospirillum sp.]|nr:L-glutamate gamma-semialdehyde dehydrogenase [Magnetospirillum sp.]